MNFILTRGKLFVLSVLLSRMDSFLGCMDVAAFSSSLDPL